MESFCPKIYIMESKDFYRKKDFYKNLLLYRYSTFDSVITFIFHGVLF